LNLFSTCLGHFFLWPEVIQRYKSPKVLSPEIRGLKNFRPSK
jgi:hypothetical protein